MQLFDFYTYALTESVAFAADKTVKDAIDKWGWYDTLKYDTMYFADYKFKVADDQYRVRFETDTEQHWSPDHEIWIAYDILANNSFDYKETKDIFTVSGTLRDIVVKTMQDLRSEFKKRGLPPKFVGFKIYYTNQGETRDGERKTEYAEARAKIFNRAIKQALKKLGIRAKETTRVVKEKGSYRGMVESKFRFSTKFPQ